MTARRVSRTNRKRKSPGGSARFDRLLAGLSTEVLQPPTLKGLKSWVSEAARDRTLFITDTVWGTIRWKKWVGRSLGPTLSSGFLVEHFFHEIRGNDLGGGVVQDTSRWVQGPSPSVWDMPDDAEHHQVGYMFWVRRPWVNAVTISFAEKQPWGSQLSAFVRTRVRVITPDRQDFWLGDATFAVLDETTVIDVPVRVFG